MTRQELLERMRSEIDRRKYPNMSLQSQLDESIAAICVVIAEALARKPLLTLPKDRKK